MSAGKGKVWGVSNLTCAHSFRELTYRDVGLDILLIVVGIVG